MSVSETDTFESFLNCNDKCLIYLLSCDIYALQYAVPNIDPFRYRQNNYKHNNKKAETGDKHMQVDLFEHFAFFSYNGFLEDCTITLIDKTDGVDPTREKYWRKILKIVSSQG